MSDFKDKMIQDAESNPDNWTTKKCCECQAPVRINLILDQAEASGESPVYCEEHHPAGRKD